MLQKVNWKRSLLHILIDKKIVFFLFFLEKQFFEKVANTSSGGGSKPINLKVNTPVEVTIGGKPYQGLVRWCGYIEDADNTMAGLELVSSYCNT